MEGRWILLEWIPRVPYMDDIDLQDKKVLVRLDLNVPVNPDKKEVLDTSRLESHLPTLRELLEKNCSIVAMSHQGRPGTEDFLELKTHAELLSKLLGIEVKWIDDVMGPAARTIISQLRSGEMLLLDNIRFVSEEVIEASPQKHANSFLVRRLSSYFDVYINDAFATAHRSHASIVGFPAVLPSAAGRLMESELKALQKAFDPGETPKIFVLGGGKVHDSLRIIEYISRRRIAERILTTGLVAELFLVSKGIDLGRRNMEFLEEKGILSLVPRARRILLQGAPIETPVDFVVENNGNVEEQPVYSINGLIRDIGSNTVRIYGELMKESSIIVMRGPAGVMEDPRYRKGTRELVRLALDSNGYTIFGGGHLTAIVNELGRKDSAGHLSTGGAALLLLLSGEPLPAINALLLSAKKFLGWKE